MLSLVFRSSSSHLPLFLMHAAFLMLFIHALLMLYSCVTYRLQAAAGDRQEDSRTRGRAQLYNRRQRGVLPQSESAEGGKDANIALVWQCGRRYSVYFLL